MSRYDFDDEPYLVIEKHEDAGVGPFLIGLAIGAGIALLFAPRSGRATRRDIKRRAKRVRDAAEQTVTDVRHNVVDGFERARRRVEDEIETARQAVDLRKRQITRAVDAGRAAAEEARLELERKIADTKASYRAGGEGA
jgi:gas vesicle protein